MDAELLRQMFAYYDERAPEYEEAYTLGTGTASIRDPGVFTSEAKHLSAIVSRCVSGRVVDIACGTGFWLPFYARSCSHVTLFDQSERMLDECRKKLPGLDLTQRATLRQGDVLDQQFPAGTYDCALVGFLISHLTEPQEAQLFSTLKRALVPSGRFLILDSAWSPERAAVNAKIERQVRRLNDGTAFQIYKRYIDRGDVEEWERRYEVSLEIEHLGTAFVAVSGVTSIRR